MRIAYHPNGATLSAYALAQWVSAALADMDAPGGVVIRVNDPKHPYFFGPEIVADDRETQGGARFSRLRSIRRRASLEFQLCKPEIEARWRDWHLATHGGRIAFVWEEPLTGERIAVQSALSTVSRRETYRRYQPASLELIEWP